MSANLLAFVLFTLLFSICTCQKDIGDSCNLPNGVNGTCRLLRNCNKAIEALRNKVHPQPCGFNGLEPVICCAPEKLKLTQVGARAKKYCDDKYYQEPVRRKPGEVFIAAVGGFDSLAAEFPHMAVLGYNNNGDVLWGCGGSLISEQYVLTAAHCLNFQGYGPVSYVRLGDLNLKKTDDLAEPQNFTIKRAIAHKDYKRPSKYHDIALIELDRAARTTDYVAPACVQVDSVIGNTDFTATGWGRVGFLGESADHLQKVFLSAINNAECRSVYDSDKKLSRGIVDEWQICAGSDTADTCQGDSGGPLQIKKYTRAYSIIGVTSFGRACGVTKSSGVYTRVSNYIDWIESVVWPN